MKKDRFIITHLPESFLRKIDEYKARNGYNSKERSKFLRDLLKDDDFLKALDKTQKKRKTKGGGEFFGL